LRFTSHPIIVGNPTMIDLPRKGGGDSRRHRANIAEPINRRFADNGVRARLDIEGEQVAGGFAAVGVHGCGQSTIVAHAFHLADCRIPANVEKFQNVA
jgi:hypothetical protein